MNIFILGEKQLQRLQSVNQYWKIFSILVSVQAEAKKKIKQIPTLTTQQRFNDCSDFIWVLSNSHQIRSLATFFFFFDCNLYEWLLKEIATESIKMLYRIEFVEMKIWLYRNCVFELIDRNHLHLNKFTWS